ncbi:MAG: DUF3488 domain-containing protein [Sandaracinaceae bacterium]|nr:DUF3488 domain-containing protein [Sandaracinaceae bacterium]MBK8411376.1 DUF3488 domain-containing protein [Sandaracinaceae bacterium]
MSFIRLHKLITYIVASVGLFALTLGGVMRPPLVALMGVLVVASWFVDERRFLPARWSRTITAMMAALAVVQVARGFTDVSILTLSVEFVGALQVSRLYHRRSALDYQHIAVLAIIHLLAATILSSGLDYAVIFFLYVIATPWILALNHLRGEIESQHALPGATITDGPSPEAVGWMQRPLVGGGFLAGTALLSLPLFIVTALFFLLFPRVGIGFLSLGDGDSETVVGFGGDVELGGFGVIRDDPTVVMRVTPQPLPTNPPAYWPLRMRGTSFDHYEAGHWTRRLDVRERLVDIGERFMLRRRPLDGDIHLSVIVDPLDEPVVFLPERTVAVDVAPRVSNGVIVFRSLELRTGLDLRYLEPDGLPFAYEAIAAPDDASNAARDSIWVRPGLGLQLSEREAPAYLQLPAGQERIEALAREVVGDATTPAAMARRVERYLRDSGTFAYTLTQPDTTGRDPLHVFLFEARAGHCEYFSTAMAVMLRTVGVPTRNVTGFVGGQYNRFGQYYGIRNGDAHSWVEAYIDGDWRTFDPTPVARGLSGPTEVPVLTPLREMMDALRTAWQRRIVGYDLRSQVAGLRAIGRFFRSMGVLGGDDDQASRDPELSALSSRSRGATLLATASLALIALVIGLTWRQRSRTRTNPLSPDALRAQALYRVMERRLARVGVPRPPARTPTRHAESLVREGRAGADVVTAITEAYVAARFGTAGLSASDAKRWRRRLHEVR